ncbi:MAG: helix-turn-helix transcriptional regulator [Thiohalospira sp.]
MMEGTVETTQIIKRTDGEPEYAVVPYDQYQRMLERMEELIDLQETDKVRARMEAGKEESVPLELIKRIDGGESPVRVWREYRGIERRKLAEATDVGDRALYMIEAGKREPSTRVLRQLAERLNVDVDELLPPTD